jgi:putative FmdB family regulatory protein
MPTYEYACKSCGEHLEVVQSFTDDPLTDCPRCGGPLRKVFGQIGVVLKGSGFYRTDNRAGAKGATDGAKEGGGSSGSSSSSDTKAGASSAGTAGAASA